MRSFALEDDDAVGTKHSLSALLQIDLLYEERKESRCGEENTGRMLALPQGTLCCAWSYSSPAFHNRGSTRRKGWGCCLLPIGVVTSNWKEAVTPLSVASRSGITTNRQILMGWSWDWDWPALTVI